MKGKFKLRQILSVIVSVAIVTTAMPMTTIATEFSDSTEDYTQEYTLEKLDEDVNLPDEIESEVNQQNDEEAGTTNDDSLAETTDDKETLEEKATIDEEASEEDTAIDEEVSEEDTTTEQSEDNETTEETEIVQEEITISSYKAGVKELSIITIEQVTKTKVNITWNEVEGATSYVMYRMEKGADKYSRIKSVTTTESFNAGLVGGTTYYYKVEALDSNGNVLAVSDEVGITISGISTPVITSVTQKSASTAVITWDVVDGAEGYRLYRATSQDGTYSSIKNVTTNTTENYNLTSGTTYYYKVRAFKSDSDGNIEYSEYSQAYSITMAGNESSVGTPVISVLKQSSSTAVELNWSEVENAAGYELWRSTDDGQNYSRVKTVAENITNNYSLSEGTTYTYKVRAFKTNDDGKKIYGSYSEPASITIVSMSAIGTPDIISVEKASNSSVTITWTPIENVTGYKVYRSETQDGTYKCIKTVTTGTSTSNYSLTAERYYYYQVAAYIENNGKTKIGAKSQTASIYLTTLSTPTISSKVQLTTTAVTLKWGSVSNANGYEVYRSDAIDGTYEKVDDISTTSLTDEGLNVGNIYYYKVRAYKNVDGGKAYGMLTSASGVQMLEQPVISRVEQTNDTSAVIEWGAVANATSYKLYRSTTENGTYKCLKTTTDTKINSYNLINGETYYYKVQAIIENGIISNSGPQSLAKGITIFNDTQSGTIESVKWTLKRGVLTFSGEGPIDTTFSGDANITKVVIGDGITEIGDSAFSNCKNLATVIMGSGLKAIGAYAFYGDKLLDNVVIPDGVTSIGSWAFNGCTGLKKISVPGTVTDISSGVFNGIASTTVGPIGGGYDYEYGWTSEIPDGAFSGMTKLTEATITGVSSLGGSAFSGDTALTTVTLTSPLRSIGGYAFHGDKLLDNVVIPDGVTSIGSWAFNGCTGLKIITIPNSVIDISSAVFNGCNNIVIYCGSGSYAEAYAIKNNIPYVIID